MTCEWPKDDPEYFRPERRKWWHWAGLAVAVAVIGFWLTGCVSITPERRPGVLVEVQHFTPIPDDIRIGYFQFRTIARSERGADWRTVADFERFRAVAWWQERELK